MKIECIPAKGTEHGYDAGQIKFRLKKFSIWADTLLPEIIFLLTTPDLLQQPSTKLANG